MTGLASWNDGPAKRAIVDFVARAPADEVPADERVAVFGQRRFSLVREAHADPRLDFILRRLVEMTEADPGLR